MTRPATRARRPPSLGDRDLRGGAARPRRPGPGCERRRRHRRAGLRRGLGASDPTHKRRHGLRDHGRRQSLPDGRQRRHPGLEGDRRAAGERECPHRLRRAGRQRITPSAGSGSCVFSGGVTSILLSPDSRLDSAGTIHLAYIDGKTGNVYYQTFSTATNTWGARTTIGTGAQTTRAPAGPGAGRSHSRSTPRTPPRPLCDLRHLELLGTRAASRRVARPPVVVATGQNIMHPSLVTSLDGTLHAAWLDNSLATHATVRYSHFVSGSWSAPETVSAGDAVVLNNTDDDQGPSIATDPSNRPHVLFMDGTANGTNDYVRMRYRTSSGTWTDDTPPGGAGGASNPAGTLFPHAAELRVVGRGRLRLPRARRQHLAGRLRVPGRRPRRKLERVRDARPAQQVQHDRGRPRSRRLRLDPVRSAPGHEPGHHRPPLLRRERRHGGLRPPRHAVLQSPRHSGRRHRARPRPATFTPTFIGADGTADRTRSRCRAALRSVRWSWPDPRTGRQRAHDRDDRQQGQHLGEADHRDETESAPRSPRLLVHGGHASTRGRGLGDDAEEPGDPSDRQLATDRDVDRENVPTTVDVQAAGQTSFSKTYLAERHDADRR